MVENQKTYKVVSCEKCKRLMYVPKYDGWTGREIEPEATYICGECHELQEQYEVTFTGTITPVPPEIIKKIWGDITGGQG